MSKGISIHIGMHHYDSEHYGDEGLLETCEQDAMDMRDIADSQNFDSTLLLTEEATCDKLIEKLRLASRTLVAGDMLFFSYSGHGGSVPDRDGDEGADDYADETMCLYDRQFIDDELAQLWTLFDEGVRILVVSDSCHSGTVTKAPKIKKEDSDEDDIPAFKVKTLSYRKALEVYRKNKTAYEELFENMLPVDKKEIKASIKLIAGCQDDEFSFVLPYAQNSLFTDKLNKIWDSGQFVGTTDEFFEQIKEAVSSVELKDEYGKILTQTPNLYTIGKEDPEFDSQRPFGIYERGLI